MALEPPRRIPIHDATQMMSSAMRALIVNSPAHQSTKQHSVGATLGNPSLAFAFVGFPLTAAASQFLGLESSELNILFRILYALACGLLFVWVGTKGKLRFDFLILSFFVLYGARLIYDFGDARFAYIDVHSQFFLATAVIPTLAMAGGGRWYSENECLKWIIFVGFIGSVLIVYNNLTSNADAILREAREGRAWLTFLNPIAIGYQGIFVGAASAIYFFRYATGAARYFCIATFLISVYLVVISGSRGPIVALAFALVITSGANQRARISTVLMGCLAVVTIGIFGAPEIIADRFSAVGTDQSSSDRIYYLQEAMGQALDSPLVGVAYIEPITGEYPHNLLVEAVLALGIIGFSIMLLMQISVIASSWKLARSGEWWLPFSACAMLTNAWISGSIWGSGLFFILLWLLREKTRRVVEIEIAAPQPVGEH